MLTYSEDLRVAIKRHAHACASDRQVAKRDRVVWNRIKERATKPKIYLDLRMAERHGIRPETPEEFLQYLWDYYRVHKANEGPTP